MTTRLIIVGGFLGAGKTTLLLRAAQMLAAQGYRVGLVTNDQGENLVDTALAAQEDIPVAEVAGGCFCCRFPDLIKALRRLQKTVNPDVILAEPVGSCTDLAATTLRPLRSYYPELFELAPLTILLDPGRDIAAFPAPVDYLYHQQLAEAERLVLNKADLLAPAERQAWLAELKARYPWAQPLALSAQTGEGVADWLAASLREVSRDLPALELDYQKYAEAEACLGWLNARGILQTFLPFSAREWLTNLLDALAQSLAERQAPIAHLKAQATTPTAALKASLTQSGGPISWDDFRILQDFGSLAMTERLSFILNARVNLDPAALEALALQTFEKIKPQPGTRYHFSHFECFSPAPPQPTYRREG